MDQLPEFGPAAGWVAGAKREKRWVGKAKRHGMLVAFDSAVGLARLVPGNRKFITRARTREH